MNILFNRLKNKIKIYNFNYKRNNASLNKWRKISKLQKYKKCRFKINYIKKKSINWKKYY